MDEASKKNFNTIISFIKEQREMNEEEKKKISNLEQQVVDLNSQLISLRGLVMSSMRIGPTV